MNGTSNSRWDRRSRKWRQSWSKLFFNAMLHPKTVAVHQSVLRNAEAALAACAQHENNKACQNSPDPLVRQGWALKKTVENQFRDKYAGSNSERILIHVPAPNFSPAGYSLFTNLAESLSFLGVPTEVLDWNASTQELLESFRPSVLLTSDHVSYQARIDWESVAAYKRTRPLHVGLTASIEAYDHTPLPGRLAWASSHGVDFFYTFRDRDYVTSRQDYRPFFESGYPMLYVPFGANILHYYPVAGFERDLDYVIMATRKSEHMEYMRQIARKHAGFIDGPGWQHAKGFRFNRERDRYIYARARVGLNVHLPEQLEWACEVNERTYQLAACGVPQLIDHPKLLDKLFAKKDIFIADSAADYGRLFAHMLAHAEQTQQAALGAQNDVYLRHTTFHRADSLLRQLAVSKIKVLAG